MLRRLLFDNSDQTSLSLVRWISSIGVFSFIFCRYVRVGFPLAASSSLAFYIACSYHVFHLFPRLTCPKNFTCLFTISLSSFLFVFALRRTSTLVTCSVYEILCILLRNHISHASSLFNIFELSVHISDPYNNVDHT